MTVDNTVSQQADFADEPSVGLQLRRAREARGMTVEGIGAAIKLAARQVEAIESDDYARLTSATYARGFIRNYASLMGLDAQALLAQLDRHEVRARPQLVEQANVGVAMPSQSARRKWMLPLLALSVPALAAIALYVWFEFWPAGAQPAAVEPTPAVVVPPAAEATPEVPASEPVPPVDPQTAAVQAEVPPPNPSPDAAATAALPPVSAQQAPAATAVPGQRQLNFRFTADSWIEMRDAQGRVVLSELNRAGSTRSFTAVFPVSLVIGNAKSVSMDIDGAPYDLVPSTKVEVARLRLE
ncbi:Putative Transcriptional regulator [Methyloversatilis universalis FAM5]|uniref:Transcriptional regulator n=1 Tax=Methyloversatilis universalis (strain ATCC BAA-1314 / DSM 25237 / JCM 13912 / CCUG 52030 / FAM5) TaxID=1000565 RepID=F5R9C9_METUF|nr:RodZ domain-containing protein [Methyloversatilis universalis]EGK72920.1 Putative Transcriptional regulator [Methyloversatilis universalis FAM5]